MLLRIESPHFVAGAVWERRGRWVCVEAAPIINWMVGKSARDVFAYVERKRWRYTWVESTT